ncbi:MAG: hypothetical protein AAGI30_04815 [Planctomycetota bacterium]
MAAEPLFSLDGLDLSPIADRVGIAERNPHRGLIALIDEILYLDDSLRRCVGRLRVRDDAFWASGHVPTRPIMPGVLQIEAGAQVASYLYYYKASTEQFAGFTRIQDCAFRGMVEPGCDLYILVQEIKFSARRFVSDIQGLVNGQVMFDARITGMTFPHLGAVPRIPIEQPA